MIRAALLFCLGLAMAACNTVPLADTPTRAKITDSTLPPMKAFAAPSPNAPARSNANIAADFLSLHFQLESGRKLEVLTRFETPITVRVTGAPPPSLEPDLRRLLTRLRREAGIDIRQITQGAANITIEAVSRAEIRRALPQAACFVVPNVSSFDEFRRDRRKPKTNWSVLRTRTRMGIFVPHDSSPQELRDCLHEELAQALGPLNDLYRLPDSVFNDDNVHTVLTGFDMLILRATYAPELHSGMTEGQVAAKLPALLARLNPAGTHRPATPGQRHAARLDRRRSDRAWPRCGPRRPARGRHCRRAHRAGPGMAGSSPRVQPLHAGAHHPDDRSRRGATAFPCRPVLSFAVSHDSPACRLCGDPDGGL